MVISGEYENIKMSYKNCVRINTAHLLGRTPLYLFFIELFFTVLVSSFVGID